MASLGFLMLGAFMGWVIGYGLFQTNDWTKPGSVFSAVTGAAVSGAVFIFIQTLVKASDTASVTSIFFYPVGLAYGALCNGLGHTIAHAPAGQAIVRNSTIALVIASVLLLALLFGLGALLDKLNNSVGIWYDAIVKTSPNR